MNRSGGVLTLVQCIFTSEDLPCDVCRARNLPHCIKMSPRRCFSPYGYDGLFERVAKSLDTSQTGAANGSRPNFPLLLQFREWCLENPTDYGTGPSQRALRHAICAWTTRNLAPTDYMQQTEDDVCSALFELNWIIAYWRPDEMSVFASHLLAWVTYSTCSQELFAHIHFQGSLAFLSFLSNRIRMRANNPLHPALLLYGPFILDCASAWTTRNGALPIRTTTFDQRVKYFDDLRSQNNAGFWHTGILEAANSTLGNLMEISLTTINNLVKKEEQLDFSRQEVDHALQYIRAELGDSDLHAALQAIYRSFQGAQTDHSTVEGQLITRLFHRLRCILLLHTILEANSIQEGIVLPNAKYVARAIVNFCRHQAIRRGGPIEDYYLISWHNYVHLLLGGMALQATEHPECIPDKRNG